jgi:hypothetical protein
MVLYVYVLCLCILILSRIPRYDLGRQTPTFSGGFCHSGLVCGVSRIGNVFQADFSCIQSSVKCLISQSSSELWKWHRRLGHLSFNLLCPLNGLGLLRGLPLLKFESNLVCAPCHHGQMITAFHSLVNTMMTEQLRQLLHMDTIGPSLVRSMNGK